VSRIDEALKRSNPKGAATEAAPDSVFAPAWAISGNGPHRESRRTPENPHSSGEAPAVGPVSRNPGTISFSSAWRERLASSDQGHPGLVEQFRRLAATLHHEQISRGIRSVMITSSTPGDGKTLTAVNLALVLAESYRYSVLLVDADLRRPSIPSIVDLGHGGGLSEALRSPTEQKLALAAITPRLTLLPAGQPVANSIEALTSPRMRQILDEAVARYDWVILDAPPVGPTTDARLLTQMVGGTLFVIHADQTQYPQVQKAIDLLGREQILGVVLNGVETSPSEEYYYYGAPRERDEG
jgi:protein-tyrosine kinase